MVIIIIINKISCLDYVRMNTQNYAAVQITQPTTHAFYDQNVKINRTISRVVLLPQKCELYIF